MLKQNLQQKLLQKLSPQQIQMIKLLELPTLQLEQRIKKELEENPALEEGDEEDDNFQDDNNETPEESNDDDEFSFEDYLGDDDEIPNYKLNANNYSKDDEHTEMPHSSSKSFHEHLKDQLGLKKINDKQFFISEFIIGNIDEDGYLRRQPDAICDDIAFSKNISVSVDEVEEVLEMIQDLDPSGVGARDLRECLLIQIRRKEKKSDISVIAERILENLFEEFTKKHYTKIMTKCGINEEKLKSVLEIILKLNPKPGGSYGDPQHNNLQSIIPDFILEIKDGEIEISLNVRNAPELRVSRTYSDMLSNIAESVNVKKSDKEAAMFIKQKLDSAKWFIDAIKQRQNTLLFTINAIVEFQKEFFLEGDETLLRPMILKDIAEITGLDISTISRVANSKYVSTPYGNYLLKHFFSEAMQTESGEEVSTREIKQILKDCVDNEAKNKPLTDEKLAEILKEKGYKIARRTIAKYREQLGIPVARLRKEL
jgi:RNA polymerase sigma-54 factor